MKIKTKLVRAGGTIVTLGSTNYHFVGKDGADDQHVCEVGNREHIARFLAIPEAYEIADVPKTKGKKVDKAEPEGGGDDVGGEASGDPDSDGKDPE